MLSINITLRRGPRQSPPRLSSPPPALRCVRWRIMASCGGLDLEPSTDTDLTEAARTALRARGLRRVFAAAAYRDFRYLWLAQMTNSAAMWVQMVGLPLLVLEVTDGSALHLGLVMAARATPAFGLGLFAGASADYVGQAERAAGGARVGVRARDRVRRAAGWRLGGPLAHLPLRAAARRDAGVRPAGAPGDDSQHGSAGGGRQRDGVELGQRAGDAHRRGGGRRAVDSTGEHRERIRPHGGALPGGNPAAAAHPHAGPRAAGLPGSAPVAGRDARGAVLRLAHASGARRAGGRRRLLQLGGLLHPGFHTADSQGAAGGERGGLGRPLCTGGRGRRGERAAHRLSCPRAAAGADFAGGAWRYGVADGPLLRRRRTPLCLRGLRPGPAAGRGAVALPAVADDVAGGGCAGGDARARDGADRLRPGAGDGRRGACGTVGGDAGRARRAAASSRGRA